MHIPQQYKFIIKLGKALHTYGVPSYKIQNYLSQIAEQKGLRGSFMDTPTWINYVFYEKDEHTYNHIECIPPGGLDLGALSKVSEITDRVLDKEITYEQAGVKIDNLKHFKRPYEQLITLFAFMLSAGAFSIILNTNWVSTFAATFLGIFVYALNYLSFKSSYIASALESLVAFVATIGAGLLSLIFPQINISLTILASIIVFIPGLAINTALEEITSKSLVSGTAKLADALVSLFKQFFGVLLGINLLPFFIEIPPQLYYSDIPDWMEPIAILILTLSLLPVFKVRAKDMFLCVLTGFISYYVTTLMQFSGLLISIFVGTIVIVWISKLWSKLSKSPQLVFLVPGIIILVPGSKAFIGLSTFFLKTAPESSNNMGEQVMFILLGILGGLLFSGSFMNKK